MKKSLLLALALAIICIMPSCKKSCPNDPEVSNNPITFGDNEGMVVTPYENIPLVTQYGHYSWGYHVDLNGDGQDDVQFHSTIENAGGGILTELYCLENTALLGESIDNEFSLLANDTNDSFDNDNIFMCTIVILLNKDSNFFPMNETKYIGFKLTENDQSRLGWMKVILHHDYVELLETAIQK